jgi:radical SAM protein
MSHPGLSFAKFDFDVSPFLVIWETTQACPLACRHCRADAIERRDPDELTTDEGKQLLSQIRDLGTPVCVLSGGDPMRRPDLAELIRHGRDLGLRMATIPAASPELTRDKLVTLKQAGVAQIAFSLDGSTAALHDAFRQVEGSYDKTLEAIRWTRELDVPVQINSVFSRYNQHDIDAMIDLVKTLGIVFWEVFSLVPTGRGSALEPLSADEHEQLFAKLYDLSQEVRFIIKVTEAPHYRRYVLQRRAAEARVTEPGPSTNSAIPAQLARDMSAANSFGTRGKGINAGKGFCFVSHTGDVFGSGFLPMPVGNVRDESLSALYRDSWLFKQLRDPSRLEGRCGICEFADVCGGSRARAFAQTGNYLGEDTACAYQPEAATIAGA